MARTEEVYGWETPFAEAVDAFLAKGIVAREEFDGMAREMRAKSFTAAYVHGAEELKVVYDACLAALAQGRTLREFVKATEEILTRPWHRETVFRTNVLSAYGRGHFDQAQAVRSLRPYGRYSAVMDGRTRPSHARLHGLVYPLDHPFWKTYWPPWDYNCRCGVTTLSQYEVDRDGLQVRTETADLPPAGKFSSPAAGAEWQPDYGRYPQPLRGQVEERVRAIYD